MTHETIALLSIPLLFPVEIVPAATASDHPTRERLIELRCQQPIRDRIERNMHSAQVKLPDVSGDAGRRGGDAGTMKVKGDGVTDGEGGAWHCVLSSRTSRFKTGLLRVLMDD